MESLADGRRASASPPVSARSQDKDVRTIGTQQSAESKTRQKELFHRVQVAWEEAEHGIAEPIRRGRTSLIGLVFLQVVRVVAFTQEMMPTATTMSFHSLSSTADIACVVCSIPVFFCSLRGPCVRWHCVGPMVTFIFALAAIDFCSLVAYIFMLRLPRPTAPGYLSLVRKLEADIGTWESLFVASVALQAALFWSSWAVYRQLRLAGLYPPGNDTITKNKPPLMYISPLEVCCEAEDVALLPECKDCTVAGGSQLDEDNGVVHAVVLVHPVQVFEAPSKVNADLVYDSEYGVR